jgi:sirohydrochlorin cobaltochelatase
VDGFKTMTSPMQPQIGVILFAHGSRDPLWRSPIDAVAQRVREKRPDQPVAVSFLELTEPDLPSTVEELMKGGVSHVRIVPMFLGVGRHARDDLPELVNGLSRAYPQMNFELLPAIGEHPAMTALMADIALGSVQSDG